MSQDIVYSMGQKIPGRFNDRFYCNVKKPKLNSIPVPHLFYALGSSAENV